MRCIFCKSDSSTSKTIEHIIPESLGNVEHILPRGVVCDSCNNYFAREIEKPVLESTYFVQARFNNYVGNKRGVIPSINALHLGSMTNVILNEKNTSLYFSARDEKDNDKLFKNIHNGKKGTLIYPEGEEPNKYLMSRFLGKVALEALVYRALDVEGWIDEIVNKEDLDLVRDYVRRGHRKLIWPFHKRVIYEESGRFEDKEFGKYQMLHEFTFEFTTEGELFFIVAIFGVEYALNLGEPDISGYIKWLSENSNKSPLYP